MFMIITEFRWRRIEKDNYEPEFVIKNENKEFILPLMYNEINFSLGDKFCVGYFKNGVKYPCPQNKKIESGYQCEICKELDEILPCTSCIGYCRNISKRSECMNTNYYIYIAIFGNLLKVGISRDSRLKHRLIEQGADFGAKIAHIKDGRIARLYEQKIKRFLGIEDRVIGYKKFQNMFFDSSLHIKDIQIAIENLKKSSFKEIFLDNIEIYDLRKYYNLISFKETKPKMIEIRNGLTISGKIISVKGNVFILQTKSEFFCVNANELIGRELK